MNLGDPIVLNVGYSMCEDCGAEYLVLTDGFRAYAHGEGREIATFLVRTERPTEIAGACTAQTEEGTCGGWVVRDLATPDSWEAATSDSLRTLSYGEPIER